MRIISFAKTWPQFLAGSQTVTRRMKQVWTDGELFFTADDPYLSELSTIWIPSWWNHAEDEPTLKPDEQFEAVEWSSAVGPRWCCDDCGWIGPTGEQHAGSVTMHLDCSGIITYRLPARGIARHIGTTIVELGEGAGCDECSETGRVVYGPVICDPRDETWVTCPTCGGGGSAEAAREGFSGLSWGEFLAKCFPGVPLDSEVARISFERIE